jgi:hypothetical protein
LVFNAPLTVTGTTESPCHLLNANAVPARSSPRLDHDYVWIKNIAVNEVQAGV